MAALSRCARGDREGRTHFYLHEVLAAMLLCNARIVCRRGRHRLRRQDQPETPRAEHEDMRMAGVSRAQRARGSNG